MKIKKELLSRETYEAKSHSRVKNKKENISGKNMVENILSKSTKLERVPSKDGDLKLKQRKSHNNLKGYSLTDKKLKEILNKNTESPTLIAPNTIASSPNSTSKHQRKFSHNLELLKKSTFMKSKSPMMNSETKLTEKHFSPVINTNPKKMMSPYRAKKPIPSNNGINININVNMNINNIITDKKPKLELPSINVKDISKEIRTKEDEILDLMSSVKYGQNKPVASSIIPRGMFDPQESSHRDNTPNGKVTSASERIFPTNLKNGKFAGIKLTREAIIEMASESPGSNGALTEKQSYIKKTTTKSKPGCNNDGSFKTNQDSLLAKSNIFNLSNFYVFGVFDGHGMHGHFVSNTIKLFFSDYFSKIDNFIKRDKFTNNQFIKSTSKNFFNNTKSSMQTKEYGILEDQVYEKLKEKEYHMVKNSFLLAENSLMQSRYEVNFSGSTSVVVIVIGDKIICANAGDSRAMMVSDDNKIIPLSRDHKPEIREESQRIIKSGGRVDRYSEHGIKSGPFRVWVKNENFPGLAMSRSIGDFVAGSVGVICEPGKSFLIFRNY
jgi:serine/threonine protein phosphatase PrpC